MIITVISIQFQIVRSSEGSFGFPNFEPGDRGRVFGNTNKTKLTVSNTGLDFEG